MIQNRHLLSDRSLAPQERLKQFFVTNIGGCEENLNGGCFIGNMCQEMSESSEAIRLKVRQTLRNSTQTIEDVLEEARLLGGLESQLSLLESYSLQLFILSFLISINSFVFTDQADYLRDQLYPKQPDTRKLITHFY